MIHLDLFDSFFCKVIFNYLQESTEKKDPNKDPSIPASPVSTHGKSDSFKFKGDPIDSISSTIPQTNLTKPEPDKDDTDQYAGEYEGTDYSVGQSTFAKDFSVHYLSVKEEAGEDDNSSVSSRSVRSAKEEDPFKTEFVKIKRQASLSLENLYGDPAARPLEASEPFSTSLEAILTDVEPVKSPSVSTSGQARRLLKKHVTFHWS